ncbi:hypothetical protein [Pseudomonas antarctica]|uniref:hypothetical protein n=1 Tax=Pseudomonas antarctica TaxID=219572 RepID=UPI00387AD324
MSGSVLNLFFTDDQVVNIKYFSTRCVPQIRDAATAIENLRQEEIDKSYVKGLQISDIVQLRDKSIEAARSLGALEGWKDKLNPALPDISKRVVGFCKETIQIIEKLPSINALALKDFTEETVKSMPGCSLSTEELDKVRVVGERIEELKGNIAGSHKTVSEFQAAITTFKQLINVEVLPRLSRIYDLFVAAGVGAEVRALSQLIQRKSDEFHFELSKLKILDNDADIAVVNARIDAKIKEIEVEIAKKELLVIAAKKWQ